MKLRYYQLEALECIKKSYNEGYLNQLVSLPTGAGKTVLFSSIPSYLHLTGTTLILAHQENLLLQARQKWLDINPTHIVGIEQAENTLDPTIKYDCIIASMQTLRKERLQKLVDNYSFSLVVIDESHHSLCASYLNIIEKLRCRIEDKRESPLLVGVTATPFRGSGKLLDSVFSKHVYNYSILQAMKDKFLCEIRAWRLKTTIDLTTISNTDGDFNQSELEDSVNVAIRNEAIIEKWNSLGRGNKTLCFCVGISHAEEMAKCFRDSGIKNVYCIHSKSPTAQEDIIAFKEDTEPCVATNVGVMVEGLDIEDLDFLLLVRPTKSQVLFTQMLGRGLRLHPSKKFLKVLDVVDIIKKNKAITTPVILSLPTEFDLEGSSLLEAKASMDKLFAKNTDLSGAMSKLVKEDKVPLDLASLKTELERICLLVPDDIRGAAEGCSTLEWQVDDNEAILNNDTLNSNKYVLRVPATNEKEERILRLEKEIGSPWKLDIYAPDPKVKELQKKLRQYGMLMQDKSKFFMYKNLYDKTKKEIANLSIIKKGTIKLQDSFEKSVEIIDSKVRESYPWALNLIDINALWRSSKPSDNQLKLAKKQGIPVSKEITKGGLSRLLDRKLRIK